MCRVSSYLLFVTHYKEDNLISLIGYRINIIINITEMLPPFDVTFCNPTQLTTYLCLIRYDAGHVSRAYDVCVLPTWSRKRLNLPHPTQHKSLSQSIRDHVNEALEYST